ncbi:hypothetical protein [Chryseobacterium culicis]|uniref:Transposase n=1 Tax=Chryseobacterium culicis TaxID=680127 RepID=A0A1H6H9M9_CHRCI|nr:hypothetical protein [Chryseobacterium culicis]SEH32507.1 hypothetical protein SAMN05421593_1823 [Chryseobacterium culicis]
MSNPDYKKIYTDIILRKYPNKMDACKKYLEKHDMSAVDIITLNTMIFGADSKNHKHKSYSISDIKEILDYQFKYNLTNIDLARHFNLSRNTVTKWKKAFVIGALSDQE